MKKHYSIIEKATGHRVLRPTSTLSAVKQVLNYKNRSMREKQPLLWLDWVRDTYDVVEMEVSDNVSIEELYGDDFEL